jgi:hypothetical protein
MVMCAAPPRALGDSQGGEVRAKVGQLVKLFCAVEADPPALIQWTKDDEGMIIVFSCLFFTSTVAMVT